MRWKSEVSYPQLSVNILTNLIYTARKRMEHIPKYKKVFHHDPQLLYEMLTLYQVGAGPSYLARRYRVDHKSILYQVHKFHITRFEELQETKIPTIKPKYEALLVEPVNQGKTYREYREAAEKKRRHFRTREEIQAHINEILSEREKTYAYYTKNKSLVI